MTNKSLVARLFRRLLGTALLTVVLATALISYLSWSHAAERFGKLADQTISAFAPALVSSVQLVDKPQTQNLVNSISQMEGIMRVQVDTFTGENFPPKTNKHKVTNI